jgi:hypothetical protein
MHINLIYRLFLGNLSSSKFVVYIHKFIFEGNLAYDNIQEHHVNMRKCLDVVLMVLLKHGDGTFMNLAGISMLFLSHSKGLRGPVWCMSIVKESNDIHAVKCWFIATDGIASNTQMSQRNLSFLLTCLGKCVVHLFSDVLTLALTRKSAF